MLRFFIKIYYQLLDYKKKRYIFSLVQRGLSIGNNVVIMDGFFIDPTHCFLISIGDNSVLAPNVRLIAHDASTKQMLGYTKIGKIQIEENCFIGDSAIILPGVTIGKGSVIGAGSVVTKDIPPGMVAAGNPCRAICRVAECKEKHEKLIATRMVPYSDINQDKLTNNQKDEVCKFLDSDEGYVR